MISKRVYTKEYISRLREGSKCDPAILERSVFALGLLEAFARTGADFIFYLSLLFFMQKAFDL